MYKQKEYIENKIGNEEVKIEPIKKIPEELYQKKNEEEAKRRLQEKEGEEEAKRKESLKKKTDEAKKRLQEFDQEEEELQRLNFELKKKETIKRKTEEAKKRLQDLDQEEKELQKLTFELEKKESIKNAFIASNLRDKKKYDVIDVDIDENNFIKSDLNYDTKRESRFLEIF
jgi:hypothetical protein